MLVVSAHGVLKLCTRQSRFFLFAPRTEKQITKSDPDSATDSDIVNSLYNNISRVPHNLRRVRSPQVEAEELGLGRCTLTGDGAGAKDATSGMLNRRELQTRTGTVAGLDRSAGWPPHEGGLPVDGYCFPRAG